MLFWPLLKELHETNSMDDSVFVSRAQYVVRVYVVPQGLQDTDKRTEFHLSFDTWQSSQLKMEQDGPSGSSLR
jgi:hypothetical protein